MTEYYDTLVLSGGSIKAISILGALQYCYDKKLLQGIKTYIGTSAGAIICYLLIIGYQPSELVAWFCTHNVFNDTMIDLRNIIAGQGVMSFSKVNEQLERLTINKIGYLQTFRDVKETFKKNLVISTYNKTKREMQYKSFLTTPEMPILVALRMSCSLPFVFEPFKYMDEYYIDGGIGDHFPILYDIEQDTQSVKSHRLGIALDFYDTNNSNPSSIIEHIYDVLQILLLQNFHKQMELAKNIDIIKIKIEQYNIFNFKLSSKEKMDLFSVGYQHSKYYFEPENDTINSDLEDY